MAKSERWYPFSIGDDFAVQAALLKFSGVGANGVLNTGREPAGRDI